MTSDPFPPKYIEVDRAILTSLLCLATSLRNQDLVDRMKDQLTAKPHSLQAPIQRELVGDFDMACWLLEAFGRVEEGPGEPARDHERGEADV